MADPQQPDKKLYSIPAHLSFLDALAAGVLAKAGDDPLKLADYNIIVPDGEMKRALQHAFITQMQGRTQVMPHITSLAGLDDEHLSLEISNDPLLSQALMDMPPAVSRLDRQLILAQEILKLPGMASAPHKAIALGGELGRFIDVAQRYDVDIADLARLVPDSFKAQWAKTADFLKIITETWPKKLEELACVDPEDHKNAVLYVQALHWQQHPHNRPVIAAGFSEDHPALRTLLQSVEKLPQGAVVLQGLDTDLDAQSWDALTPVHPQHALKTLLAALGHDRADVETWEAEPVAASTLPRIAGLKAVRAARDKLLRETMRPSGTAEGWTSLMAPKPKKKGSKKNAPAQTGGIEAESLTGLDLITTGTPQEEASVIALKMRESLEQKGRSVTLVTADRNLARRVSARLRRWKIEVPDDSGTPLASSPIGVYLLATANMAAEEWAPVALLEALKHPLTALGGDRQELRRKVAILEDMAFHGPRPGFGATGVRGVLTAAFNRAAKRPKNGKTPEQAAAERQEMLDFVDVLESAGQSFYTKMSSTQTQRFSDLLEEHIRFAEMLGSDGQMPGSARLWRGEDGVAASRFLAELRDVAKLVPDVTGRGYIDVLQELMKKVAVEPTKSSHPTLRITTPEKAGAIKDGIIILGGLNDGVWPQQGNENPWLSPDMIKALGLPGADAGVGRAAHAFVQMLSHSNVLMTRALRTGDGPSVASPFLTRLLMVLRGSNLEKAVQKKSRLLDIHTAMHMPTAVTPIEAPRPTPPVKARPKELPVTAIETLMRDPYAVYVKYVLKLRSKAPLDASPSAAERGNYTHAALEAFVDKYPTTMPDNAEEELLKIGAKTFKERINNPTVRAFWWPRFERIAKWFVKFEQERRHASAVLGTEVRGKLEIDTGDGIFTLTAIADRLDRADDKMTIIDYKTGTVPTQKNVMLGLSPQLTLEALIAFSGGFEGLEAGDVGKLQYWKLSGASPAGVVTEVKGDIKQLVTDAHAGMEALIKAFNDQATPYLVAPRPDNAPRYNSAQHLSRVDEWSTVKKTAAKSAKSSRTSSKGKPK